MTRTDQLLPDVLNGMSSTGAGITDAEMRQIMVKAFGYVPTLHLQGLILAFGRAVEARTRQATPAPDAVAEAVEVLTYVLDTRKVTCLHKHPGPDEFCANCRARAFIATHTTQKTGEG